MVKKLINIDDELFRQIQLKAINRRVTAQKIITEAIEDYFRVAQPKVSNRVAEIGSHADDTF